jgi:hypothetical protein
MRKEEVLKTQSVRRTPLTIAGFGDVRMGAMNQGTQVPSSN